MRDAREWESALCRFQNCLWLLEDQGLRRMVGMKVFRQEESNKCHRYLIIVHVKADHIFSKYFKTASQADLALFRGMFMTLDVRGDWAKRAELPVITNCEVHQAFLPKFENESQDSEIASAIQAASGQRYMMVTVKHSGSLATLSHDLMGAKNSQGNIYTAVAVLLLKAHYQRVARSKKMDATTLIKDLLSAMKAQRLSVSFEVVARCLSHHGQLPDGEYMVTTAITKLNIDGSIEVLPLADHLSFCIAHRLPVNDAWLFSSPAAAAAADAALDAIANAALPTAAALTVLDSVAAQHPSAAIRIHGTYPHAAWQGSRIEGFVIAQGGPVDTDVHTHLQQHARALRGHTLPLPKTRGGAHDRAARAGEADAGGARFAAAVLQASRVPRGADRTDSGSEELMKKVASAMEEAAPELKFLMGSWASVSDREREQLTSLVRAHPVPLAADLCMPQRGASRGRMLPSRPAVADAAAAALRSLAGTNVEAQQHLGLTPPSGTHEAPLDTSESSGNFTRFDLNAAMQALAGPLLLSRGLRYKKKAWSFRTAADALPPALTPLLSAPGPLPQPPSPPADDAASQAPAHTDASVGPANADAIAARLTGEAVAGGDRGSGAAVDAHVAYCMMTFIIRNGLRHLREGPAAYEGYIAKQMRRWGLPAEQRARVQEFGRSWDAWARAHGHTHTITETLYLDTAEQFVQHFLSSRTSSGPPAAADTSRPPASRTTSSRHTGSSSSSRRSSFSDRGSSTAGEAVSGSLTAAGSGRKARGRRSRGAASGGGLSSTSHSDSSLTALAGHCSLPSRPRLRGLLVLVGFTDGEVAAIAEGACAAGHGTVPMHGADLRRGWVAGLEQVPGPEALAFWEEAVPLLKVAVRSGTAPALEAPQARASGSSVAAAPKPDDDKLHSAVWSRLASMSRSLPSSLLRAHLQQGIAKHGSDWLLARWLEIRASPGPATTGCTPGGSHQSLLHEPESHAGRSGKQKLSKAGKQRRRKPASHRGTQVPGSAAVDGGTASNTKGATFTTSSMADEHKKAAIAEVIEWLGRGVPMKDSATGTPQPTSDTINDPVIVVVFISTPGLGKTSVCEALMRSLEPSKYHVVHHHSDAQSMPQRKRFWPAVNSLALTRRGDGRTTVVLADKNLLDEPEGNWEKAAATINAPVLAVLLTDAKTATPFKPVPPDAAATPSAADAASSAAPAGDAAAAAAAKGISRIKLSDTHYTGNHGSAPKSPAAGAPGVDAPFSMEQLALAMLRVLRRQDHVGGLDGRLDQVLQIMCGFAGAFRGRPAAAAVRHLAATFDHVHVLPVTAATSSAPPPPAADHRTLTRLVAEGFRRGRFGGGDRYGVPRDWEPRMRELLGMGPVAAYLDGLALPLDAIASDLKGAVEHALVAEAARSGRAATPGTPDRAAAAPSDTAAKLRRTEYVAVGGFARTVVAEAFATAQRQAVGGDDQGSTVQVAKEELHITLWHCGDGAHARGLACVAAEGSPVEFVITGFDVTPTLSAARVEFTEPASGPVGAEVLAVELPHITMHVGRGEKAVNARRLRRRQEGGEAGVRWLPLQEPLRLTGKVHIAARRRLQ